MVDESLTEILQFESDNYVYLEIINRFNYFEEIIIYAMRYIDLSRN